MVHCIPILSLACVEFWSKRPGAKKDEPILYGHLIFHLFSIFFPSFGISSITGKDLKDNSSSPTAFYLIATCDRCLTRLLGARRRAHSDRCLTPPFRSTSQGALRRVSDIPLRSPSQGALRQVSDTTLRSLSQGLPPCNGWLGRN